MDDGASATCDSTSDAVIASDDPSERVPEALCVDERPSLGQLRLRALVAFEAGDIIQPFSARRLVRRPARMTVQVSESEHAWLAPAFLENVNHSCDPNVAFDTRQWALVALTAIAAGDELVFFYPSTEWHMASSFVCACGSARCLGKITGASRLSRARLSTQRLAPHIQRLIELEDRTEQALEMGLFLPMFAAG